MPELFDSVTFGELLGLLAHDLRNPLSALHSNLGFLTSIVREDGDAIEAVADGLVSCEGLAHIIDNIDLLGQTMRGVHYGEGARIDLFTLVGDVVSSAKSMAESHNVTVVVLPRSGDPPAVSGPRELLGRALSNLLRNSIQHSPSGASVHIAVVQDEAGAGVRVEDSGAALPDAIRSTVFTPKGQINSKTAPAGRYSRGLGLLSAALAAAAAQASVRVVTSSNGKGNAFELRFAALTAER